MFGVLACSHDACVGPWELFWGGTWIGKSVPGLQFVLKSFKLFNKSICRVERFFEGSKWAMGANSGAKAAPR